MTDGKKTGGGPWGATLVDNGNSASLFVSYVLGTNRGAMAPLKGQSAGQPAACSLEWEQGLTLRAVPSREGASRSVVLPIVAQRAAPGLRCAARAKSPGPAAACRQLSGQALRAGSPARSLCAVARRQFGSPAQVAPTPTLPPPHTHTLFP